MIRRDQGNEFVLITQQDHALLSGELARHVGNGLFARPAPFDRVIQGISLHDCGWPTHDNHPTLNANGQPRHVFESTPDISLPIFTTSVDRVIAKDKYAGLLVSLHTMALVAHAATHQSEDASENARQELFRLNRFLHRQIEIQEGVRLSLGMRIDLPLRGGLAGPGRSEDEDLLLANFHLLEFLDQLSLILCFDRMVFDKVRPLFSQPGTAPLEMRIERESENIVRVDPWPFDVEQIEMQIPARRVPARIYESEAEFKQIYAAAPMDMVNLKVRVWQAK
jgi:hypothetical protein